MFTLTVEVDNQTNIVHRLAQSFSLKQWSKYDNKMGGTIFSLAALPVPLQ